MGLRPIPRYYMQMMEWWNLSALYAAVPEELCNLSVLHAELPVGLSESKCSPIFCANRTKFIFALPHFHIQ